MKDSGCLVTKGMLAALAALVGASSAVGDEPAQVGRVAAAAQESARSIDEDYEQQRLELERRRLERLERLAERQAPADAAISYERLFRLAIAGNLFDRVEPAAERVLKAGSPSPAVTALAHLVNVIAEADRGAYDQSLASLDAAVADAKAAGREGKPRAELPTDELVGLCDAYYQRLIHGGRYDAARKALTVLLAHTERPALREFLSAHLKRLDVVGKPAPAVRGTDLDGRRFDLAASKGDVVLINFWASWCLPCAAEMDALHQVEEAYRGKGLRIVGINLDTAGVGQDRSSVLPNVRRFILDYNVRWPTLIDGAGENGIAEAFGVTEIPANVLIARDGTVQEIDLVEKNLEPVIARAVGR